LPAPSKSIASPRERCDAVNARHGDELTRLLRRAIPAAMTSRATPERKYIRLVEVADRVQKLIAPFTPCARGCSQCCHMPMGISRREAEVIAAATGRKYSLPDANRVDVPALLAAAGGDLRKAEEWMWDEMVRRHIGVPCPFLRGSECGVYAVRPLACRLHHVVEDDAAKCGPGKPQKPVSLEMKEFDAARAELFREEPFADIREFFRD
jgi:Fe-S-cluster containining protein